MRSTEADIRFPAVGFTPDGEMWGFDDINALTECGSQTLKQNLQSGMEVIGSDGRRWAVRSVKRIGRNRSFLPWMFWSVLSGPGWRIEQELEELSSVRFDDIRARAIQFLDAHPEDHCPDGTQSEEYHRLLAQLRAAKSVAELIELLGLDWFIAY